MRHVIIRNARDDKCASINEHYEMPFSLWTFFSTKDSERMPASCQKMEAPAVKLFHATFNKNAHIKRGNRNKHMGHIFREGKGSI